MRNVITAILLLAALPVPVRAGSPDSTVFKTRLCPVGTGYAATSVNTAVFRCESVVSLGGVQYTAFYDGDGYFVLAKRKLGDTDWEIRRTAYRGKAEDAHNVISLGLDGEGFLHAALDHHGDSLHYFRSAAPGSLEMEETGGMTGKDEADVTYPEFHPTAGGGLLFVYRSGVSGRGNLVMNRYDLKTRKWSRVHDILIDGEGSRSAYWQMCTDFRGVIHLSWVWRETWDAGTNHDLCYARSFDGGLTWRKTDGTKYDLPIRQENAEYACRIPEGSELINQTGMAADADGNPVIASYWSDGDGVPQYRLVWHDGTSWRERPVTERSVPFTLGGGGTKMLPASRPRVVLDGKKAYYLFRDAERGSRVSMAYTDDYASGRWKVTDLTAFPVGAWEPTIDTGLWDRERKLHVFVEKTHQGDGERTVAIPAQPIYILEVDIDEDI